MPKPLHKTATPVRGDFIGSTETQDYYLSHDLDHVWIVRTSPGHTFVSEQGFSFAVLQLLSFGEHDLANALKAAKAMLE